LDGELILRQFEHIESRIEHLVKIGRDKDAVIQQLSARIENLEEELRNKVEAEKRYSEERQAIRSRIDQLLARLKNIIGDE
jgi:chromosome segregation ATPase